MSFHFHSPFSATKQRSPQNITNQKENYEEIKNKKGLEEVIKHVNSPNNHFVKLKTK